MSRTLFLIYFILMAACSSIDALVEDNIPEMPSQPLNYTLGISFPPVADAEQRAFTAPLLQELNVNTIRFAEDWRLREPAQGQFNWAPLDQRMQWAEANNLKVRLTIQSNGPDWACSAISNANSCVYTNNDPFKNYIESLLQRYPDKIYKIQFGNEWQTDFWYIGTAQEFVTANNIVYNAVQQYSPNTKFVLGGFTTASARFLAGCAGEVDEFFDDEGTLYDTAYFEENCNAPQLTAIKDRIDFVLENASYDEVDLHLYDDAENWHIYVEVMKEMIEKPIIITEFGGPNVNIEPQDEAYQSERLEVYINTINNLDVEEAYFFKLVEGTKNPAHVESGLINSPDLEKKLSFETFKRLNK